VNVVIVGCGRVGGFLAGLLDSEGHRVSVVDIASTSPARAERAWFQHLPSSFKVNDPVRAQTYREMGINTFSRTTILGTLLHAMLQDDREVGEVLVRKALAHEADMVHEPVKAR